MKLDPFIYGPLQDDQIRLLRILPSSRKSNLHVSLETTSTSTTTPPQYEALSYCWGDASKTHPITVNGKHMRITSSLHDALTAILKEHRRAHCRRQGSTHWLRPLTCTSAIWADALCINQRDDAEKSRQVLKMWQIYHHATSVAVWLGQPTRYTGIAFQAVEQASECPQAEDGYHTGPWSWGSWKKPTDICSQAETHRQLLDKELEGLLDLLSRPYFKRAWVIQEYSQASTIKMLCGNYVFDPVRLYHATAVPRIRAHESQKAFVRLHGSWGGSRTAHDHRDVDQTVAMYLDSLCTDPRDKIFAMLGHPGMRKPGESPELSPLEIDYSMDMHEILLCFLEWNDRVTRFPGFPGTLMASSYVVPEASKNAIWGRFFMVCRKLQLPETRDWFALYPDLDCSQVADCIVLRSGRRISCGGAVLSELTFSLYCKGLLIAEHESDDKTGDQSWSSYCGM